MDADFINSLVSTQVEIPAIVNRLAGFFLSMQALLIVFRKKNDPYMNIWEDISGVLLAGLVVYLFPEITKFLELAVNSLCPVQENTSTVWQQMSESFFPPAGEDSADDGGGFSAIGVFLASLMSGTATGGANVGTYGIAMLILKPLADFVNTLCFPTYWIIRAVSLNITYWVAPLILVLGAMQPFRALWKHWLMIYVALLVAGPALVAANNFCESCFALYINSSGSPVLGFIIVAMARYKAFQAVIDLCYRIFSV